MIRPDSRRLAAVVALATLPVRGLLAADAAAPTPRRLAIGVDAVASAATADEGYYDDTSYGRSSMRLLRLRVTGSLRLGSRAALLAEGRADNGEGVTLAAAYLRVRPLPERPFDIQAGRIPPVFGAFPRRSYAIDNPLIGQPLVYQYLTSLRADALPATADDLLVMRGRGWRSHYPIGNGEWTRGLPVIAGDRWDTGVEVRLGQAPLSLSAALTQGTLSDPRVRDDNDGKQLSARLEARPVVGLVLGASASGGEYVSHAAAGALPSPLGRGSYSQRALGADAEYSRGYWLVRGEWVLSRWAVPPVQDPLVTDSLRAWGGFLEARYKIRPGLYAAARVDHLGFSEVTGTWYDGLPTPWEAPVWRLEGAAGYSIRRNLLLKAALQHNWRVGVTSGPETVAGLQALVWF